MKRLLFICLFFILIGSTATHATIWDGESEALEPWNHPNFYDDVTGRIWLDMDNFDSDITLGDKVTNNILAGYTIATFADVQDLYSHIGQNQSSGTIWSYINGNDYNGPYHPVMGIIYGPEFKQEQDDSDFARWGWADNGTDVDPFYTYYSLANEYDMTDRGVWAYIETNQGNIVPIPSTISLFGLGILCLAGLSRKKLVK